MFIIRDDDTSFWTSAEELDRVYGDLIRRGFKISLSAVPYAYKQVNCGDRQKFYQEDDRRYLYENSELVTYLKDLIKAGSVEIMQHGYDHSYKVRAGSDLFFLDQQHSLLIRDKKGTLEAECVHKTAEQLREDVKIGREILEDTFAARINVFVPPSNALTRESAKVIADQGLNISGAMLSSFNREINLFSIRNYLVKGFWRAMHDRALTYPYVLQYAKHKELSGNSLTKSSSEARLRIQYRFTESQHCDFVLATHYWELLENNEKLHKQLMELLTSLEIGPGKSALMSEAFK